MDIPSLQGFDASGPDLTSTGGLFDRLEDASDDGRTILFECTRDGELLSASARFSGLEAAAGLPAGGLAAKLVAMVAPGNRSVVATISLELSAGPRQFVVRFVPVSTSGRNDLKLVGAMRDVSAELLTDRADPLAVSRSEELARVSSDWYWETNTHGLLTSVSASLEVLLGKRPGELLGRPLASIGTLLRGDAGDVPMELAAERGSSFRDQLFAIELPSGATRLYRLAGVAIWDKSGKGTGYRGVAAAISNSTRIIERMRSELSRAAKQNFLSAMSHELRTPLNAIIGFAEAMRGQIHGPLDPHYVDYAGDIANAGRHLLGLIQDLLDISSLESGEVDLACEEFDIVDVANQALAMVGMKARARGISLDRLEAARRVVVRADRRRTLQIFVNLLGNAVKFTPSEGAVGMSLDIDDAVGEVSATVWDTGPGIAPRDHDRVFEKFEQLPAPSQVSSDEGVGLGLHISRRLANLMGGSLTLDSDEGAGARFTLTLPAA
jgi:signal transduction histidine kinase